MTCTPHCCKQNVFPQDLNKIKKEAKMGFHDVFIKRVLERSGGSTKGAIWVIANIKTCLVHYLNKMKKSKKGFHGVFIKGFFNKGVILVIAIIE